MVTPAVVEVSVIVPPAVPTAAMTAFSRFIPVSIRIVSPVAKRSTLETLILVVPASDGTDRMVAGEVVKSAQLLSVSWPSGKRPVLVLGAEADASGPNPPAKPGAAAKQPLLSTPESA